MPTNLDHLKCKHGNIVACKECDDEFIQAMFEAGKRAAIAQDEAMLRILLQPPTPTRKEQL